MTISLTNSEYSDEYFGYAFMISGIQKKGVSISAIILDINGSGGKITQATVMENVDTTVDDLHLMLVKGSVHKEGRIASVYLWKYVY